MTTPPSAVSSLDAPALVRSLRSLRPTLAAGGLRADRENRDTAENMSLLADAGAARLMVPKQYGGLWEGGLFGGWGPLIRAMTEIGAGDGPTCQNWGTTALVAREIFDSGSDLPDETRQDVARRLLDEGLRMTASNAETGVGRTVVARPVSGGVVLSGTKSFNTNSGGHGLANVGCALGGRPGRHHVLVELTDPDVEFHDDWDNMGQRGTDSQTISSEDHDDLASVTVDGFRAKAACAEASLTAAATVHEVAGARATAGKFGLDRFWRNARTFASHDPTDAKNVYVGSYEVTGELPPVSSFLRV